MGSYGIGVNRTMQAIVEHSCDKDGIIWPDSVAPLSRDRDPCQFGE